MENKDILPATIAALIAGGLSLVAVMWYLDNREDVTADILEAGTGIEVERGVLKTYEVEWRCKGESRRARVVQGKDTRAALNVIRKEKRGQSCMVLTVNPSDKPCCGSERIVKE